jgi:2-polyprenyl-3-methyl-5-hydroxy-6-metoxy-1,4-benzoquinol methylase
MGVQERLTLQAVAEPTLLAVEHIHRYEFAAALCAGMRVLDLCCGSGYGSEILAGRADSVHGVDYDAATIDTATASVGRDPGGAITFELGDATEFLRAPDLAGRFDAIVCFEGLEHLPDVTATLEELRRHAAAGIAVVASVPNSRGMHEDNEFHLSDFGYAEAHAAFNDFPDGQIVHQYLAEGSLIAVDDAGDVDARLYGLERAEPPYANHYLLVAGIDRERLEGAHRARMQVALAPTYNRYMRSLERANTELRRRNNQLTRGLLGKADSAAPSYIKRTEAQLAELAQRRQDIVEMQGELDLRQRRIHRLEEQLEHARAAAARPAPAPPPSPLVAIVARVIATVTRLAARLRR